MRPDDGLPEIPDDLSSLTDLVVPDDLSGLIEPEPVGPTAAETVAEMQVPDDLSALFTPKAGRQAAMLLVPLRSARALAATCALAGIDADVVGSNYAPLAILRDLRDDAPERAAAALSQLLRGVEVMLVSRGSDHISASRYLDGTRVGDTPLALLLAGAESEVEDLILGQIELQQFSGQVTPSKGLSKLQAMRILSPFRGPKRKPAQDHD
ncbi:MAG: hypothetical protein FWG11_03570 [Promicromonosporaceae bacterium]|nr:hypothetical protein [Promicromonosporaceae bacterium]